MLSPPRPTRQTGQRASGGSAQGIGQRSQGGCGFLAENGRIEGGDSLVDQPLDAQLRVPNGPRSSKDLQRLGALPFGEWPVAETPLEQGSILRLVLRSCPGQPNR